MSDGRKPRPCGSTLDHVPHPWDGGRHWCKGGGKYAGVVKPAPHPDAPRCGHTYTGPTGIVWDCLGAEHYTDPNAGLCGSGHTMVARPRMPALT